MKNSKNRPKITLLQLKNGLDKANNLKNLDYLMKSAIGENSDIVVLPEMFPIAYSSEIMLQTAEFLSGDLVSQLKNWAIKGQFDIMAGSFPEVATDGKCYNTALYIDKQGEIRGEYRKLHLFDVNFEGIRITESDFVIAGSEVAVFDTDYGRVGIAICYDIRFPELFSNMRKQGAKLIFVPAVFNAITGKAHWELLARSRALDNQLFVVGCQQAASDLVDFKSYGHSIVINPWGKVIHSLGSEQGSLSFSLDLSEVDEVRKKLPLEEHRRELDRN